MEIVRTIRLPLQPSAADRDALAATLAAYALGCNTARDVAEANGRTRNAMTLQRLCYGQVRAVSGLPAQLAVSAIRQVAATYKTLRAAKRADVPAFRPTCATLQGGARARDFRLLPGQRVSISTVKGRVKVPYTSDNRATRVLADQRLTPQMASLTLKNDDLALEILLTEKVDDERFEEELGSPLTVPDYAYIAGIIDGEGCINIRHRTSRGRDYYVGNLIVGMTDRHFIEWLHNGLGGSVNESDRPKFPTHKTMYTLHLYGPRLIALIEGCLPFVRVKRRQAVALLKLHELQALSRTTIGGANQREEQAALHDDMRRLNKESRGKQPAPEGRLTEDA